MRTGGEVGAAGRGPAPAGLSLAEAQRRLDEVGANTLPGAARPATWRLLLRQFTHRFAILLWVAAGLAWLAGLPQLAIAIVVVVLVNGVFAFVQEHRADRAADRLRDLMPATASVRRDGRLVTVPAAELVPGDLVVLEAGARISADMRTVSADALAVDESMLTGESVPRQVGPDEPLHAGTFVVQGNAQAQVEETGARTRLAGIATLTRETRRRRSPLALRLDRVVRVISLAAAGIGAAFFGLAVLVGMPTIDGFLLALGVTVALVPEGLLPTVTLSLARGAQRMAASHALVRNLDAVETLGSVTYICTDKTGTLTRNEMAVIRVWTPAGMAEVSGSGYEPQGEVAAPPPVAQAVARLASSAVRASTGRLVAHEDRWQPSGDPMEVALHVLALRAGVDVAAEAAPSTTHPFDPIRKRMSTVVGSELHVKGAPESVLDRCAGDTVAAAAAAQAMAVDGLRVLAVARRTADGLGRDADADERELELLGVVGLADPLRPDVVEAVAACHAASIRVAVVTGDHPATARGIAGQAGLLGENPLVVEGTQLPDDEGALGELLDRDGVVVARVSPEQKLRITRALQARGHVVAMTGDGVNDAPALRVADIGVAMGATGSDVAREAADLVLLDDHFATIVTAVELGRATFANIRRFLTYHLTDNVAELAPFVVWALSGGSFPLAITVLQVLALDIGTDLLPALALGAEPPGPRVLRGPARTGALIDRGVLGRAFGVLGPAEVLVSLGAFVAVLLAGGWSWGVAPDATLLATASGTAFSAIVLGQFANAYACRSETRPFYRIDPRTNRLLPTALAVELGILIGCLAIAPVARLLGGTLPTALGWALAVCAIPAVLLADTLHKFARHTGVR